MWLIIPKISRLWWNDLRKGNTGCFKDTGGVSERHSDGPSSYVKAKKGDGLEILLHIVKIYAKLLRNMVCGTREISYWDVRMTCMGLTSRTVVEPDDTRHHEVAGFQSVLYKHVSLCKDWDRWLETRGHLRGRRAGEWNWCKEGERSFLRHTIH